MAHLNYNIMNLTSMQIIRILTLALMIIQTALASGVLSGPSEWMPPAWLCQLVQFQAPSIVERLVRLVLFAHTNPDTGEK